MNSFSSGFPSKKLFLPSLQLVVYYIRSAPHKLCFQFNFAAKQLYGRTELEFELNWVVWIQNSGLNQYKLWKYKGIWKHFIELEFYLNVSNRFNLLISILKMIFQMSHHSFLLHDKLIGNISILYFTQYNKLHYWAFNQIYVEKKSLTFSYPKLLLYC